MILAVVVLSNLLVLVGAVLILWALKHTREAHEELYQSYMTSLKTLHELVVDVSRVNARNTSEITKLREQLDERDKLIK